MEPKDRIIVALDVSDPHRALLKVQELQEHVGLFKIGHEFIYTCLGVLLHGEEKERWAVSSLFDILGRRYFLDTKLHDIPNTVGSASLVIASKLRPFMFNVHALGGEEALRRAALGKGTSLALAVSVLTSHSHEEAEYLFGTTIREKVVMCARDAANAGMDGIICSPEEISLVRKLPLSEGFLIVTPGTRPDYAPHNDQKRVMTPREAIEAGADYLVLGRPITSPPFGIEDSACAALLVTREIEEGMRRRQ